MTEEKPRWKKNVIQEIERNTKFPEITYDKAEESYMATFPYPYMNGILHIGHAFTLLKSDFQTNYQRLKGKNALFPIGFHGTGMPIQASADGLRREFDRYGENIDNQSRSDVPRYSSLVKMDIPKEIIPKFTDANYWLHYFPGEATKHIQKLGCQVDWSRCFITTPINSYYDRFVQWQFNTLKQKGLIKLGERPCIYSPIDQQQCADHDRSIGEGARILKKYIVEVKWDGKWYNILLDEVPQYQIEELQFDPRQSFYVLNDTITSNRLLKNMKWQKLVKELPGEENEHSMTFCGLKENRHITSQCGFRIKFSKELLENPLKYREFYEASERVISRSGNDCVITYMEQWYFDYGNVNWTASVMRVLDRMTLEPELRASLKEAAEWIGVWACSRTYGLGSNIPWDSQYKIESLSDSTIYMAYYTVAHFLHAGDIYGTNPNPEYNIKPKDMTHEVWDYIFLGGELPKETTISLETLKKMRAEFQFRYPFNIRISGKDLIRNHLVMSLFHHVAIFGESMCPKQYFTNGYALINKKKMSKNDGNFITISDAIDKYSADAVRLCLAAAGDSTDDANFDEDFCENVVVAIYDEMEIIKKYPVGLTHIDLSYFDYATRVFINEMRRLTRKVDVYYKNLNYQNVVKYGFYGMISLRNNYLKHNPVFVDFGMHYYRQYLATMMSPIIPFFSRNIYQGKFEYPVDNVDPELVKHVRMIDYIGRTLKRCKKATKQAEILYCSNFTNFDINEVLGPACNDRINEIPVVDKKEKGKIMSWAAFVRDEFKEFGYPILHSFDMEDFLTRNKEYICEELNLDDFTAHEIPMIEKDMHKGLNFLTPLCKYV